MRNDRELKTVDLLIKIDRRCHYHASFREYFPNRRSKKSQEMTRHWNHIRSFFS